MNKLAKEYSLKYKFSTIAAEQMKDSQDLYNFCHQIFNQDTVFLFEEIFAVYLDASNHVKGFMRIGEGGMNNVVCDPKKVFMGALACAASSVAITHNHPSGDPRPSEEDRKLTKKLVTASKLLDMCFDDHVICGQGRYYSFRDHFELCE